MNLVFRHIRPSFYATHDLTDALRVALDQPQPKRDDEEQRLREYLANQHREYLANLQAKAEANAKTSHTIEDLINRATEAAEANGGWGDAPAGAYEPREEASEAYDSLPPFHIGDVVTLASGGTRMTVEDLDFCPHCGVWDVDLIWSVDGEIRELWGVDSRVLTMAGE